MPSVSVTVGFAAISLSRSDTLSSRRSAPLINVCFVSVAASNAFAATSRGALGSTYCSPARYFATAAVAVASSVTVSVVSAR